MLLLAGYAAEWLEFKTRSDQLSCLDSAVYQCEPITYS